MYPIPHNEGLEAYIQEEIIVDAYDEEEIAACWEQYLSDTLQFPFVAYGSGDREMIGSHRFRMSILGLHPTAQVGIRQVLLLARLQDYDLHFAIRMEDLWPPDGWEFDPGWEEGDEPDPWQVLYHWCFWVQHMT
jgi:hypothetical protein